MRIYRSLDNYFDLCFDFRMNTISNTQHKCVSDNYHDDEGIPQ